MQFELTKYSLPTFWACALINDDFSGLSDQEEEQINKWLAKNKGDMGQGHWGLDLEDQEPSFRKYHDAQSVGVLACDCYELVWNKRLVLNNRYLSEANFLQVQNFLTSLYEGLGIMTLQTKSVMSAIETEIKDIEAKGLYGKRFNVSKNISVLVYENQNFEVHVSIEGKISTYEDFKRREDVK